MRLNYEAEPEDAVQDEHDDFLRADRAALLRRGGVCGDCGYPNRNANGQWHRCIAHRRD